MKPFPAQIISADDHYNAKVRIQRDALFSRVDEVHATLQSEAPAQDRLTRAADAFALNAVWGFEVGAKHCFAIGSVVGTPKLALGAGRFSLGYGLSAPTSALCANLLVGDYGPIHQGPGVSSISQLRDTLASRGLVGLGIQALTQQAEAAIQKQSATQLNLCLWGAAILSVASSCMRAIVLLVSFPIAIGVGTTLGMIAGAAAGLIKMIDEPAGAIVDFECAFERVTKALQPTLTHALA